jgi:hypothetical protein
MLGPLAARGLGSPIGREGRRKVPSEVRCLAVRPGPAAIPADGVGAVTFVVADHRRSEPACALDDESFEPGTDVVIVRWDHGIAIVRPAGRHEAGDESAGSGHGDE